MDTDGSLTEGVYAILRWNKRVKFSDEPRVLMEQLCYLFYCARNIDAEGIR